MRTCSVIHPLVELLLQTNPANVERIVDRQIDPPPDLATKAKARQTKDNTSTDSFAKHYNPSNTLRQRGRGDIFYKVVWQGRFVEASWCGTISPIRIAISALVDTLGYECDCPLLLWRNLSAAAVIRCRTRVTRDMLLQSAVTRGMVYEYEDNLAEKKQTELEMLHRNH